MLTDPSFQARNAIKQAAQVIAQMLTISVAATLKVCIKTQVSVTTMFAPVTVFQAHTSSF
jgi:hypothetical protein